jgi:hypothetical protein
MPATIPSLPGAKVIKAILSIVGMTSDELQKLL